MIYHSTLTLRDGRTCTIRSAAETDAPAVLANFILTHEQTDRLLTYADEIKTTPAQERAFLKHAYESPREVQLLAEVDGVVAGLAGISPVGVTDKVKHRAELGIGRAMLRGCIACARRAGFDQLELEVVSDNEAALALYKSEGFVICGENPLGFRLRTGEPQPLTAMRLEL